MAMFVPLCVCVCWEEAGKEKRGEDTEREKAREGKKKKNQKRRETKKKGGWKHNKNAANANRMAR